MAERVGAGLCGLLLAACAGSGGAGSAAAEPAPEDVSYLFYVASESEDEVSLLRFTPGAGLTREKVIPVGRLPAEIEAPHGLFVDPTGDWWYLTLGHGFPNGQLLKYETGSDTVVATTELGLFPATIAVSGALALAVNANFHGDHEPSTVSVVETGSMMELDQVETCTMPHGSRFSADGRHHYSACMMDNRLVEIDAAALDVTRTLDLAPPGGGMCSPTWATPSPDGRHVYVPCNRGDAILEVDREAWEVTRTIGAPGAPYNLDLTPDGRKLLGTLKGGAAIAVWDVESGEQLARIETELRVTHGIVSTPDSRYALVTVEGVGGEPGMVEVFDLQRYARVATAEVGKQAGGIAFWKSETVP